MNRCGWLFTSGVIMTALIAGLAVGAARSAPRNDDEDKDARAEAHAVARQAFVENCLMCHGEDMTSRQRLTPKQWGAEVEKMIGWGTPLPPERKDGLVAWLSETYPHTQPAPPVPQITPAEALASDRQESPTIEPFEPLGNSQRGAALFAQHCTACHGAAARGGEVGVNLVTKPILTRGADFHALLQQGRRRMPSFATVLDPPARDDLLAYLRRTR